MADNMGITELDNISLNSMTNSWSKQAYVQGFYCETIYFKKAVNIFERMETAEDIYEGAVTPYLKKLPGQNPTVLDSLGIREENIPRQTLTPQRMRALASAVNYMYIA